MLEGKTMGIKGTLNSSAAIGHDARSSGSASEPDVLLSAQQCASFAAVTVGTWWAWSREIEGFPKSLKLSARCTRWRRSEVEIWLETCRSK